MRDKKTSFFFLSLFFLCLFVGSSYGVTLTLTDGRVANTTLISIPQNLYAGREFRVHQSFNVSLVIIDTSVPGTVAPNSCLWAETDCGGTFLNLHTAYPAQTSGGVTFFDFNNTQFTAAQSCYSLICTNTNTAWTAPKFGDSTPVNTTYTDWINNAATAGSTADRQHTVYNKMIVTSSDTVGSANLYPFSVTENNTNGLTAVEHIQTGFNQTNYFYTYALSCDISTTSLWYEQFKLGYNFSKQNVSFNVVPSEQFLTSSGFVYTINSTFTQFSMAKVANDASRQTQTFSLNYMTQQNNSMELTIFDHAGQITDWLKFNKTNNNVVVSHVVLGVGEVNFGNATITGGQSIISIVYVPATDPTSGQSYFKETVYYNNVSIGAVSTILYTGIDMKEFDLNSNTNGSIITLQSMGMTKSANVPYPAYTQFQNGQCITSNTTMVTTCVNGNSQEQGSGFTIYPGINNDFRAGCQYSADGTYTQRHYMSDQNNLNDYSNFHDLTVVVSSGSSTSGGSGTNANNDIFGGLFSDFGFSIALSDSLKMFLWMMASVIVAGIAGGLIVVFAHSEGLAIMIGGTLFAGMLALGVIISWMPLWVGLVLVIFCAALLGVLYRTVFAG